MKKCSGSLPEKTDNHYFLQFVRPRMFKNPNSQYLLICSCIGFAVNRYGWLWCLLRNSKGLGSLISRTLIVVDCCFIIILEGVTMRKIWCLVSGLHSLIKIV